MSLEKRGPNRVWEELCWSLGRVGVGDPLPALDWHLAGSGQLRDLLRKGASLVSEGPPWPSEGLGWTRLGGPFIQGPQSGPRGAQPGSWGGACALHSCSLEVVHFGDHPDPQETEVHAA